MHVPFAAFQGGPAPPLMAALGLGVILKTKEHFLASNVHKPERSTRNRSSLFLSDPQLSNWKTQA
jgi:hypothetical protein